MNSIIGPSQWGASKSYYSVQLIERSQGWRGEVLPLNVVCLSLCLIRELRARRKQPLQNPVVTRAAENCAQYRMNFP
jgi:hypothetical protein